MRRILTLGLVIATAVGVVGCNSGGKTGTRKSAGTSSVNSSTGTASADAPQIAGVSPANGPVDGGTAVIISGSNFTKAGAGQTMVLFGTRGVVVTPVSDTEIQVTSPLQTAQGVVDVRVINDLGAATQPAAYTYNALAPALTFKPGVGSTDLATSRGTRITIDVQGIAPLAAGVTVEFAAIAVAPAMITIVDADTLTAEVPTGLTPGPTPITVTMGTTSATGQNFQVQGHASLVWGDLIINEMFFDAQVDTNGDGVQGGGNNQSDEFIEIVNTTARTIDLTWMNLRDATPAVIHQFPNPTTIPAGGSIVIFSGGTPAESFGPRHTSGHAQVSTSGTLNLSNSNPETLTIQDPSPAFPANPAVIFSITISTPGATMSWVNVNDGAIIGAGTQTASAADYVQHPDRTVSPGVTVKVSPGTRIDGTSF